MPSRHPASLPQTVSPADLRAVAAEKPEAHAAPVTRFLHSAIFFFLCVFAILLPHSIKGSQHAWQIAFLLWLVSLAVERKRPFPQPLAAPLLAYVVLSGISSALSPDPSLSWDRMKVVCLILPGIVVAQNVGRLKQVRTLVFVLILSGLAAVGFTAWQYTYGVGVRVMYTMLGSPLAQAHIYPVDMVQSINGHPVHTAADFERAVEQSPPGSLLRINYVRGFPFHAKETYITREAVMKSGLGTPALQLTRAKPQKAQGTVGHYVTFAEIMMQIGCLTWALLLSADPHKRRLRVFLAFAFVALTAALFLTESRAALGALALGSFVAVLMLSGRRSRIWATAGLLIFAVAALLWIHHTRGQQWLGVNDPGAQFRLMMWQDAVRLIGQHPWFGVGMESIRHHWMEWHIRAFSFFHDESHFHNDIIQIAVERGLPAAAAWLWFVIAYVIFLVKLIARAREHSRFATGVAAGLLSGFVAYQITAVVHYNLGVESLAMMLFFYVGLAIATDRILQWPGAVDVS